MSDTTDPDSEGDAERPGWAVEAPTPAIAEKQAEAELDRYDAETDAVDAKTEGTRSRTGRESRWDLVRIGVIVVGVLWIVAMALHLVPWGGQWYAVALIVGALGSKLIPDKP